MLEDLITISFIYPMYLCFVWTAAFIAVTLSGLFQAPLWLLGTALALPTIFLLSQLLCGWVDLDQHVLLTTVTWLRPPGPSAPRSGPPGRRRAGGGAEGDQVRGEPGQPQAVEDHLYGGEEVGNGLHFSCIWCSTGGFFRMSSQVHVTV